LVQQYVSSCVWHAFADHNKKFAAMATVINMKPGRFLTAPPTIIYFCDVKLAVLLDVNACFEVEIELEVDVDSVFPEIAPVVADAVDMLVVVEAALVEAAADSVDVMVVADADTAEADVKVISAVEAVDIEVVAADAVDEPVEALAVEEVAALPICVLKLVVSDVAEVTPTVSEVPVLVVDSLAVALLIDEAELVDAEVAAVVATALVVNADVNVVVEEVATVLVVNDVATALVAEVVAAMLVANDVVGTALVVNEVATALLAEPVVAREELLAIGEETLTVPTIPAPA